MSTVNQRSAATTHAPDQNTSVPFHPHAPDILGTSQMERTPPRFPIRLSTPAAAPGLSAPMAVAVMKNGASAPSTHRDDRLGGRMASIALGSPPPAVTKPAAEKRHAI